MHLLADLSASPFKCSRAIPGLELASKDPLKRGSRDVCPEKGVVMLIVVSEVVGICFVLMLLNCMPHPFMLGTSDLVPHRPYPYVEKVPAPDGGRPMLVIPRM